VPELAQGESLRLRWHPSAFAIMVEILKAMTQAHAPLSQSQTVKVFQYLEEMNKDTQKQLREFMRSVEKNTSGIGDQVLDMRVLGSRVDTVQQELVKANTRMSALRVDILGNAANVVVLQEQATKGGEDLGQLREGQKVTNTNVHNLREDHLIAKDEIRKLQKEMASLKEAKESVLQAKLDRAELSLRQVKEEQELVKMRTYNNEDTCRSFRQALSVAQANIEKLENVSSNGVKRLAELTIKADATKENLEMTNGVVMKLHEEHEETRTKAFQNFNNASGNEIAVERLRDDHNRFANNLQVVNAELSKLAAGQDTTRDKLNETLIRIGGLSGGNINMQNAIHELGKNLEVVHNLAQHTEDHLKMTNAFVLPNLGAEGAFSPSTVSNSATTLVASATQSSRRSEIHGSRGSLGTSPRKHGSPRKRKEALWLSRNVGAVPDRMAWI
jgi:chromosome segregation ATPase